MLVLSVSILSLCLSLVESRLHSLPDDTYAFPKYRVTFLNGLPVLNETAQRWLKDGLRGGELEFLDQPWKEDSWHIPIPPKEIGSGGDRQAFTEPAVSKPPYPKLERMKIGPRDTYLCLIPSPLDSRSTTPDDPQSETTPVHSWSLLQPLSGTCLYHRQGWFTYSYCHNEQIRQFRELPHPHPHPAGGYEPEEDREWESYTLGRAPHAPEPGADLTIAEQSAIAANLELARGAGSRYLVQRWGDGTLCDKTGRKREVEVQFHCSMTMTDTILFVKEAKTCSYILVIHTPRLCSEPGFKSRLESREEAFIRCREIVDMVADQHSDHMELPESDRPYKLPSRKQNPIISSSEVKDGRNNDKDSKYDDLIRKALEALVGSSAKGINFQDGDQPQFMIEKLSDDGELLIEFVDEVEAFGDGGGGIDHGAIAEALRAAGFDIKKGKTEGKKEKEQKKPLPNPERDEL